MKEVGYKRILNHSSYRKRLEKGKSVEAENRLIIILGKREPGITVNGHMGSY